MGKQTQGSNSFQASSPTAPQFGGVPRPNFQGGGGPASFDPSSVDKEAIRSVIDEIRDTRSNFGGQASPLGDQISSGVQGLRDQYQAAREDLDARRNAASANARQQFGQIASLASRPRAALTGQAFNSPGPRIRERIAALRGQQPGSQA